MYSSTHMSIAVNHLVSVLCIVCNLKWCVWCTGCLFWWNCCFKALTLVSWWMNNWVNIFHQSPKQQHIIFLLSVKRYLICSHTKLWWKIVISKLNESTSPSPSPQSKSDWEGFITFRWVWFDLIGPVKIEKGNSDNYAVQWLIQQ